MTDSTRWISVGELAHAFAPDSNTPPPTSELAGRSLVFHFENGQTVEHRFETESELTWTVTQGPGLGREARETYTATTIRERLYFVDFVRHLDRATAVSMVVDLDLAVVTALMARLPDEAEARRSLLERASAGEELTAVTALFMSGTVGTPYTPDAGRLRPTSDLVGRRVEYTYSSTERYEHVYLNDGFYTWHCLQGSEKGLADTDRCHYYKLGTDLYLFVWREKIVPTLGVVVVDFDAMRTTGKIFGYEGGDFSKIVNFRVGAHARVLNVTRRDDTAAT
jgi:hypothetical protein